MPAVTTWAPAWRFVVPTTTLIPIVVLQGDTPVLDFTAGSALAGAATVAIVVKANADAPDAFGTEISGVITDYPGGVFTIGLTSGVTASAGAYFHKITARSGSGQRRTLQHGKLRVEPA